MLANNYNPLISIIVPVYHVECYLDACVQSILQQTYKHLEIILVDDGSPDSCGDICDSYQQQDTRVIVVHQANGGLSVARNAGLDICKGEFIAFVDSDDMIHCQYVEMLLKNIGTADFVYCNYTLFSKDELIDVKQRLPATNSGLLSPTDAYQKLINFEETSIVVSWNKLYRRFLWEDLRFKSSVLHEDEHIIHHLIYRTHKIAHIDQTLVYYRQRDESITSNKKNSQSFLDKHQGYYDRYLFFKKMGMVQETSVVLDFILYRCTMKTIKQDNEVWQQINSLGNILSAGDISCRLKVVLLLKKYLYPLYTLLYGMKKKGLAR